MSNLQGTVGPNFWTFNSGLQAALAAAGEATLTCPYFGPAGFPAGQPMPSDGAAPRTLNTGNARGFMYAPCMYVVTQEANVQYAVQITQTSAGATSIQVKVKNVGSVGGTSQWGVAIAVWDCGESS